MTQCLNAIHSVSKESINKVMAMNHCTNDDIVHHCINVLLLPRFARQLFFVSQTIDHFFEHRKHPDPLSR